MKAERQEVYGLNDKRLIIKLKKKDLNALDTLIKEYSAYVLTIARNILNSMSAEDIEEVASDVFFRIWENAESLDEKRDLSPYLAACTRNCALNKLRESRDEIHSDLLMSEISISSNIEKDFELTEQVEIITDCLDTLSEQDKEIFIRFYYYGEKLTDICKLMDLSISSGKSKLFRTRKKIREYLTERGYCNEK